MFIPSVHTLLSATAGNIIMCILNTPVPRRWCIIYHFLWYKYSSIHVYIFGTADTKLVSRKEILSF